MALVQQQPAPYVATLFRKRGEARPVTLSLQLNGEPKDITGYRFTLTIAKSPNSVPIYRGATTIVDGADGLVSLMIPASATTVPAGNYALEIRYLTPAGIDQVVATLNLTLLPSLSLT
jgi:hypothetical protein